MDEKNFLNVLHFKRIGTSLEINFNLEIHTEETF